MTHQLFVSGGVLLLLCAPVLAEEKKEPAVGEGHYVKVELKGKLSNKPIPKIGRLIVIDENHDAVLLVSTDSWRLVFPKDKDIREAAGKLDGKTVLVTGTLELREMFGRVELPPATGRPQPPSSPLPPLYVVRVTGLKAAEGK